MQLHGAERHAPHDAVDFLARGIDEYPNRQHLRADGAHHGLGLLQM